MLFRSVVNLQHDGSARGKGLIEKEEEMVSLVESWCDGPALAGIDLAGENGGRTELVLRKVGAGRDEVDGARAGSGKALAWGGNTLGSLFPNRAAVGIEDGDLVSGEAGLGRSEERRVGKECRSRWSPYH